MQRRYLARALLAVLLVPCARARAQDGIFVTAGRYLGGTPSESSWHLTVQHDIVGPLGVDASLLKLPGSRTISSTTSNSLAAMIGRDGTTFRVPSPTDPVPGSGDLYGVGGDLALFSGAHGVPTFLVGIAGGIGTGAQPKLWAGSSIGIRMPVIIVGPIRLMAEGRWRNLTVEGRNGIELGVALGYRANRHESRGDGVGLWVPPPTADILRERGIPDAKAHLLGNIVSTAIDEMGQPYVWGGTGNGSGGFDCSGLIQYAYARYNLAIPRTAAGQALAGVAIRKNLETLLPGDILVFSDHGDQPTHVGLYVGDGKFIHSASKGVRLSRLSEDDTEGRLWLRRWVGVRRIVD